MSQHKSLIIEDDVVSQRLLTNIVTKKGFEAIVCNNGAEGLYHYIKDPEIKLVLLDIMMPEVDGDQFLRIIESLQESGLLERKANVIVQTGVAKYAYLTRLLNHPAVFSVRTKPINKQDLEIDIARLLEEESA